MYSRDRVPCVRSTYSHVKQLQKNPLPVKGEHSALYFPCWPLTDIHIALFNMKGSGKCRFKFGSYLDVKWTDRIYMPPNSDTLNIKHNTEIFEVNEKGSIILGFRKHEKERGRWIP